MRYKIIHNTSYNYTKPVTLEPHTVRLRARSDCTQSLQSFFLEIFPEPAEVSDVLDLNGNNLLRIRFKDPTDRLQIKVTSEIETFRSNPFNYFLEPWASKLPIDYPASLLAKLQPYFQPFGRTTPIDPVAVGLAHEIWQDVGGNTSSFVTELNQRIRENCKHQIRETGPPLPAGITWNQKSGSCRDLAVLFIEVCRAIGLAARFVSGYQEGNPNWTRRYLHGWAEVYLPGGGWLGYDPSHGLAVGDRHIALVASAIQKHTIPIYGIFRGAGAQSEMNVDLSIQLLTEPEKVSPKNLILGQASTGEIGTALQAKGLRDKEIAAALEAIAYWTQSNRELSWENLSRSTQSGENKIKGFGQKTYNLLKDIAAIEPL